MNYISAGLRMPAELGRGEDAERFDDTERIYLDEQISKVRKLLMSYSSRRIDSKEILFGNGDNWKPGISSRTGKKIHEMEDPEALFEIRLDREEREGLYWTLLLMAHPSSPLPQPVSVLDEIVWPVARAIDADRQLAKHLKLEKKKTRKIAWNDDSQWDRKDSRKLELVDGPEKTMETAKKADA